MRIILKLVLGYTVRFPGIENRNAVYLNDKGTEMNLQEYLLQHGLELPKNERKQARY